MASQELAQRNPSVQSPANPATSDSYQSIGELASDLPPAKVLQIAQQAAIASLDLSLENAENVRVLNTLDDHQPVSSQPEFQAVWSHLQRQLWRTIPEPVLTTDPSIDLGAMSCSQVMLNPSQYDHPDDKWFVMSHEVAHAELGHSSRRAALDHVGRASTDESDQFRGVLQKAKWDLELEADRRGLQMVADKLTDPAQILLSLMETREGPEHPDGLSRASSARIALQEKGVSVSDEVWAGLLEQTQARRDRFAQLAADEKEYRKSLSKFV